MVTDAEKEKCHAENFMPIIAKTEKAFRTLYAEERGKVQRLLQGMTGNGPVAEELTQEAFIKAWLGLSQFAWRSTLRTWVFTVAINTARDWLRSPAARGIPNNLSGQITEDGDAPDPRIQEALMEIEEDGRALLLLHYHEGLALKEMSLVMRIPVGTVKSRLHYAKEKLRAGLLARGCDV